MGPKIQAAVEFVEQGGERAVVCRPEGVVEALEGGAGLWLINISRHMMHTSITGDNPKKTLYTGLGHLSEVYQ